MRCACSAHAEQDFTGDASESDLCKAFAKARELEIFVYDELLKMHKVVHTCSARALRAHASLHRHCTTNAGEGAGGEGGHSTRCGPTTRAGPTAVETRLTYYSTRYSLLTTYSLLFAYYLLLATHYSLLTTHCSLLTTHCSLLTTGRRQLWRPRVHRPDRGVSGPADRRDTRHERARCTARASRDRPQRNPMHALDVAPLCISLLDAAMLAR